MKASRALELPCDMCRRMGLGDDEAATASTAAKPKPGLTHRRFGMARSHTCAGSKCDGRSFSGPRTPSCRARRAFHSSNPSTFQGEAATMVNNIKDEDLRNDAFKGFLQIKKDGNFEKAATQPAGLTTSA